MKNIAFILLVLTLGFSSCSKEAKDTVVNITVKDASGTLENFSVYMFKASTWNSMGNDIFFAKKTSVTDANGVAKFILNDDLDIIDDQTTFYFSVFYTKNGESQSYTKDVGVTVEKGDKVEKELFLNQKFENLKT